MKKLLYSECIFLMARRDSIITSRTVIHSGRLATVFNSCGVILKSLWSPNCVMHCWTATEARPGLPRVVRAAIKVANSFKISICSRLLWGPRSRAQLSLPHWLLCMSIPAVATRLSTTHRRSISLIHFAWLMSVMNCWAIGKMLVDASSFDWMRGIWLVSIFPALLAPVRHPWSCVQGSW